MQQKFLLGSDPAGFHRVAYAEWGAKTTRPPVVCLHGLTRNGRDFDRLAAALAGETRVLCPDMPGRGKSDWLTDPASYNYAQYIADATALVARADTEAVDWVGTSMGGILGIFMAAGQATPIGKLVINDVGPSISLAALKRIGTYVSILPEFTDLAAAERYMRQIYAPFGNLGDADWRHLAEHGCRALPNGKLTLGHDPAIAKIFLTLDKDADFWGSYDAIRCPVLLLRGSQSDVLSREVAEEMTRRGPRAELVEFPGIGHAPGLMDPEQIRLIRDFLRR